MTAGHRRPVCIGCQRPCAADEGYRTTTGFVHVCSPCVTANRPAWMRAEKASRLRALEVAEGLA